MLKFLLTNKSSQSYVMSYVVFCLHIWKLPHMWKYKHVEHFIHVWKKSICCKNAQFTRDDSFFSHVFHMLE